MPETLVYTAADGTTFDLYDQSSTYARGVDGRFSPPIVILSDVVPNTDGSVFRSARFADRVVTVPLVVTSTNRQTLRSLVATAARTMNSKKGVGSLRLTTQGGTSYDLHCVLNDGLQASDSDGSPMLQRLVLQFLANDPYWYDTTAVTANYSTGGTTGSFFPFLRSSWLASSTVFATDTITNSGDDEAWPVWTITGPGDSLVLRNNTTNETLTVTQTLSAGQTMVIDTRPGQKTVTVDGVSVFSSITGSLWSLETGANSVSVQLNSSTSATLVNVSYQRKVLAV